MTDGACKHSPTSSSDMFVRVQPRSEGPVMVIVSHTGNIIYLMKTVFALLQMELNLSAYESQEVV